jgi:serine phosphatase RsbU (regulator of sigma subunit)
MTRTPSPNASRRARDGAGFRAALRGTGRTAVLQSSLRPPSLPEIDGVRLAARYRPAAEHLDIGGDFYDVHGTDGDWLVALGDVCGRGIEAALTGRPAKASAPLRISTGGSTHCWVC